MDKLTTAQKHIINLIARDKKEDEWTSVSSVLYPQLSKNIPKELATFEKTDIGGRAKLTTLGESIHYAMKWL